ncbi:hypothetical protein ACWNYO_00675 [Candidatus Vidania fulgoroideorum]
MRHIPSMFFNVLKRIKKNIIDCTMGLGNYIYISKIKKKIVISFEKDKRYYLFSRKKTINKDFFNINKIIKTKSKTLVCDLGYSINQNNKKLPESIQEFLFKSIKILKGKGSILILCFNHFETKNIIYYLKKFSLFLNYKHIKVNEKCINKNPSSKTSILFTINYI